VNWNLRFLSAVEESCSNAVNQGIPVPGCTTAGAFDPSLSHNMHSMLYNDVQVSWADAFRLTGLKVEGGVNNLFGLNPPICYTCTLNGYDAGTYDLPGAFWYARATYKF
jgi:iron complex outermembrane receptor protein